MSLREKLSQFKKKSNQTLGITGILLTFIIFLSLFLLFVLLEYSFWFNTFVRSILFIVLIGIATYFIVVRIGRPILTYLGYLKSESDEEIANRLTKKIPEIKDELINYLQLEKEAESELAKASLDQKTGHLSKVDFLKAIDFNINKKYTKYLVGVLVIFSFIALINPPILSSGATRLVKFNTEFLRPAPFEFIILNDSLKGFQNEEFKLRIKLTGENIPSSVDYIGQNGRTQLKPEPDGTFTYGIKRLNSEIDFHLEASGFKSLSHKIELLNTPELNLMSIQLDYPNHTFLTSETITNGGNLNVPSGTVATWVLGTNHTNKAKITFSDETSPARQLSQKKFSLSRKLKQSGSYSIALQNEFAINESDLTYKINVRIDEFPKIEVEFLADTSLHKFVVITGSIQDDYGFNSLYLVTELGDKKIRRPISIDKKTKNQQFYTEWLADPSGISAGQEITIYMMVADNDKPKGFKTSKSQVFQFRKPNLSEISNIIDKKTKGTEKQFDKSLSEMKQLREKLDELSDRLKSQKNTGWQEEKLIEESLEKRKALENMLKELHQKHKDLLKANQNIEQSDELKEKAEKLNELMDNLMDPETKKLFEELKKLLQEKGKTNEIRDKLDQIKRQENRMIKDLKRTKELFKRLKMETGLELLSQQLDSLSSEQIDLSKENIDSPSLQKQQEINKDFDGLAKDLKKLEELNQELKRPEPLDDFAPDEKQIRQELDNSKEQMELGDKSKAKKSQQDAAKSMQQMSKKMQKMQAGMEMEAIQENIEQLRKILDDLVRLSYEQETLLKDFKTVNSSDPRFITLSQDQIKLKEDLVIIKDSLLALAGRVVQLSSFITKEIEEIDHHLAGSVEQIKERQRGRALSHQQFSMTSMNNLALLLNDVLQNMQMSMSEAMGKPSKGKPKDMPMPSLGEMQKKLGDQISELGKDGKSGEKLSEELARMAAEQEMIRQQLQQMQEDLHGQFGGKEMSDNLSKAIKLMEDNEIDLVNKRISKQLIQRQKEITTRMLEAEEALREQEKEPEREGETGKQKSRTFPPNYEEYLKTRKKEIELLRSVPLELKPFYKKEVNDYFRRLSEDNK